MKKNCFVMMPFGDKFNGIWKNVIKPSVEECGDICVRSDNIFNAGVIINDIIKCIRSADYLIAELTNKNPNVYYELGFAHASNKPVILIT